jgi:hypothetical protein
MLPISVMLYLLMSPPHAAILLLTTGTLKSIIMHTGGETERFAQPNLLL